MCILLKINTSMKPITTEASHRQTYRHNSSVAFANGRTLEKKVDFGKFFLASSNYAYSTEIENFVIIFFLVKKFQNKKFNLFMIFMLQFMYFTMDFFSTLKPRGEGVDQPLPLPPLATRLD